MDGILLDLSTEALAGLDWIGGRYHSAEILRSAYDEETGRIPFADLVACFVATAGDGGNVGTIPCAGPAIVNPVRKAWDVEGVEEYCLDLAQAYGRGFHDFDRALALALAKFGISAIAEEA